MRGIWSVGVGVYKGPQPDCPSGSAEWSIVTQFSLVLGHFLRVVSACWSFLQLNLDNSQLTKAQDPGLWRRRLG